jgi:hypothetical protein
MGDVNLVLARFPSSFATLIFFGFVACIVYVLGANRVCPMDYETIGLSSDHGKNVGQRNLSDNESREYDKYLAGDLPYILKYLDAKAEQNKHDYELAGQQRKSPQWVTKFFCDAKIGDISIAFFTWCLVIVGGLQASRLRETIATMEQTERPFMIFAENFAISGLTSPPNETGKVKLALTYSFRNYGRSPALLRRYSIVIRIDRELPPVPDYEAYQQTRYTVAVNGNFGSLKAAEIFFDADDIVRLFNNDAEFWIFGDVEYTGTARLIHHHRFALVMIFEGGDQSVRFVPHGPDSYWENT